MFPPTHFEAFPEYDDVAGVPLAAAEQLVRQALVEAEKQHGPESLQVAGRLVQLAKVVLAISARTGQQAKAGPPLRRALAIATAAYGPRDVRLLGLFELLAVQIMSTSQSAEARVLRERALQIAEASYGPDAPEVAVVLGRLAGQHPYDPSRAEPLRRRALAIDEAALGPNHPRIADDLAALASSLQEWDCSNDLGAGTMVPDGHGGYAIERPKPPPDRSAEVEALRRRALAVAESAHGLDHPALVERLCELADVVPSFSKQQPADRHDLIRVQGARENNLKDVSVELPKRRITVFTGVSGSGKSSLVFATIAAESQRLINETYSAFVQGFLPTLARPDVALLEGLTTAILVDQERIGASVRSTVGTATDASALLRVLWSRLGTPHVGSPKAFAFNVPSVTGVGQLKIAKGGGKTEKRAFTIQGGMCPRCEGIGQISDFDLTQLYDDSKSLREGAITIPGFSMDGWYGRIFTGCGFFDPDKPIKKHTKKELADLLHKEPTKIKISGVNLTYEGIIPKIQKSHLSKDASSMQPHIRAFVERAITFSTCPECAGTRLNQAARSSKIRKINIAEACSMQISDLAEWVRGLNEPSVAPLLQSLRESLDAFVEIGLGYLSLDRSSGTLSGGEAQRIKMVRHLGSALTDITYVFDEPSAGLHPHDIQRMNELLLRLRDKGNTVLVVEHKPETIAIADHVVDLGPGAGDAGGTVVFEGSLEGLRKSGTLTGRHLSVRASLKRALRMPSGVLKVRGARTHNLQNVDVDIPLGVLVVVTGVAGSGKSSLLRGHVRGGAGVVSVDQAPIRGSRRSNPATYTDLLEPIRKAFAKHNGVKPALFSANSEGACPTCNGAGVIYTDLAMMAGVTSVCEDCEGKRFQPSVLEYKLAGLDIAQVLDLPVSEALRFFAEGNAKTPAAHAILLRLADVGLGYVRLGQPLTTLSGGERQRLKLATHLGESGDVYVLDEPTTGLHLADLEQLLGLLDRLVDAGKSVIVIEHHQAVMAHADWIIDLGPGAGHQGGRVVFEGTPKDLIAAKKPTLTGKHLAAYVAPSARRGAGR